MKRNLIPALILVLILLSACAQPSPPTTEAPPATTAPVTRVEPEAVTQQPASTQAVETSPVEPAGEGDACLACHSSPELLAASADAAGSTQAGELDKYLVDGEQFPQSVHGLNGCMSCHGGQAAEDKATAHLGMTADPGSSAQALCGECHPNVTAVHAGSLHMNLSGIRYALKQRSLLADHPAVDEAVDAVFGDYQAACGDCHVSYPEAAGGGLIAGHMFQRRPDMEATCTACHNTLAGAEFLGENGHSGDVHYTQGGMECVDCHEGSEMHGQPAECQTCHPGPEGQQLPPPNHRYDGVQSPRCETCHISVATGNDDILMHEMHGSKLSCQVCHATVYQNCESCHIEADGEVDFEASPGFLIGRNPMQTYDRPYEYVPVRHVPVEPGTFDSLGANLLKNFARVETWKYATPHNIQRNTPQTTTCTACHGSDQFFLTVDKVDPAEVEANRNVIVDQPPAEITSSEQFR